MAARSCVVPCHSAQGTTFGANSRPHKISSMSCQRVSAVQLQPSNPGAGIGRGSHNRLQDAAGYCTSFAARPVPNNRPSGRVPLVGGGSSARRQMQQLGLLLHSRQHMKQLGRGRRKAICMAVDLGEVSPIALAGGFSILGYGVLRAVVYFRLQVNEGFWCGNVTVNEEVLMQTLDIATATSS
jgi:hypothetical protein